MAHTLTQNQKNRTPKDEQRQQNFNDLFKKHAPVFHAHTGDVDIVCINYLTEHANWQDIVDVMPEIENKFIGGRREYSSAHTTIKIFLEAKGKWK